MVTYIVFWTWRSQRYLIDFDDEATAIRASIQLAEAGRLDIVIERVEYQPDPARAERILKRINERLSYEWAIGAIS